MRKPEADPVYAHLQSLSRHGGCRPASAEYLYAHRWQIWGVVMIGLFMALIDVTIVNISIPQLQRDLDAPVDTVSWVLNAYNIMFAVLLVSMGRLADQFGRRRFFLIGMTIFTIGSLLCALSWSVGRLIGFRVAAGGRRRHPGAARAGDHGAGLPARPARARARDDGGGRQHGRRARPADRRRAGRVRRVAVGRRLALDLPDQRPDRDRSGSRSRCGSCRRPTTRTPAPRSTGGEWRRSAAAVFCLTYGLVKANDRGWGSPLIVSLFAASVAARIAFALTQRYGRYPMLTHGARPQPAVHRRQHQPCCCSAIGMMGTLFMTVLVFVNLWGYSELKAALAITPVAVMAAARVAARGPALRPRPAACLRRAGAGRDGASACSRSPRCPAEPDYLAVLPAAGR